MRNDVDTDFVRFFGERLTTAAVGVTPAGGFHGYSSGIVPIVIKHGDLSKGSKARDGFLKLEQRDVIHIGTCVVVLVVDQSLDVDPLGAFRRRGCR